MAGATDAPLTVVHSVDPAVYDTGRQDPVASLDEAEPRLVVERVEDAERRGERIPDDATARVAESAPDVPVETDVLYGDPVATVPAFATTGGYDGIFVGHRGLSERQERVFGSVATAIVERSSLPVTVVR